VPVSDGCDNEVLISGTQRDETIPLLVYTTAQVVAAVMSTSVSKMFPKVACNLPVFLLLLFLAGFFALVNVVSLILAATAVNQDLFVPATVMATIITNALTGILLWQDWDLIPQKLAYITVHLIMILGIYLLAPDDLLTSYRNEKLAEAVEDTLHVNLHEPAAWLSKDGSLVSVEDAIAQGGCRPSPAVSRDRASNGEVDAATASVGAANAACGKSRSAEELAIPPYAMTSSEAWRQTLASHGRGMGEAGAARRLGARSSLRGAHLEELEQLPEHLQLEALRQRRCVRGAPPTSRGVPPAPCTARTAHMPSIHSPNRLAVPDNSGAVAVPDHRRSNVAASL